MIKLISPSGTTIHTDLTPEIEEIVKSDTNLQWFELRQKSSIKLSENAFGKINSLISELS